MKAIRIADAGDPRLAAYAGLRDPALRRAGLFVAEGRLVVERLLAAGRHRVRSVLVTDPMMPALEAVLGHVDPPPSVYVATAAILRQVAGYDFHRGCLALAERGEPPALPALLDAVGAGKATLLVLDEVSNPDNVGGLFRSGAALGAAGVLLSPGSGDPLYRKTVRVSMGASAALPWARARDWPHDLDDLAGAGFGMVALTPGGDDLDAGAAAGLPERLALVVGAEATGISPGTRARAARTLGIPMVPGVDSLNVVAAAAIALHRLRRRPPH